MHDDSGLKLSDDFQLFMPDKVEIPERYIPESDEEEELLTEEEKQQRKEKAEQMRKIVAAHRSVGLTIHGIEAVQLPPFTVQSFPPPRGRKIRCYFSDAFRQNDCLGKTGVPRQAAPKDIARHKSRATNSNAFHWNMLPAVVSDLGVLTFLPSQLQLARLDQGRNRKQIW